MNQILYTGGKNKKGGSGSMQKVIIFFAIFIIIFAICIIMIGLNLFNKVKKPTDLGNNIGNTNTTPGEQIKSNINVEFEPQVGAIKISIASNLKIENMIYWWDDEATTTIEIGETQYETVIPSKHGTHILNMEITDENGYVKEENLEVIGASEEELPEVTIGTDGISKYVIKAKDNNEVAKIVIDLNGEIQEIEVNAKEYEYSVDIPVGDSLISVTVYNSNGLSTNKKAKIANFRGQN